MHARIFLRYLLLGFLVTGAAGAAPLATGEVPFPLKPWTKWVLADFPEFNCPHLYSNPSQRRCSWSTPLQLDVTANGGHFSAQWQVYADTGPVQELMKNDA